MKVKSESEVAQSCPTLRDPMDCSLPGSSVHAIFQARVLEWAAIAFSNGAGMKVKVESEKTGLKLSIQKTNIMASRPIISPGETSGPRETTATTDWPWAPPFTSWIQFFVTPWTVAYQAPPSMGFSWQEYWSGLPFPSPMHESEK